MKDALIPCTIISLPVHIYLRIENMSRLLCLACSYQWSFETPASAWIHQLGRARLRRGVILVVIGTHDRPKKTCVPISSDYMASRNLVSL